MEHDDLPEASISTTFVVLNIRMNSSTTERCKYYAHSASGLQSAKKWMKQKRKSGFTVCRPTCSGGAASRT